jgi:hypothetical protein
MITFVPMFRLSSLVFSLIFVFGVAAHGQNASRSGDLYAERGYFDDLIENPGEYSYVILIFIVVGYLLWRGQRLGEDD